ncbi:MAG: ABC-F family ATP-binding cassette domain-containing protein [Pseudonocardiales bacterium]|nr:ABC-F family ATP-binding cassette domain-containing protein [Pseudonocardiales bacterium]
MSFSLLCARDLVKVYGDRRVLDGVSLTASPGQRLGLVGENGVGKSTLLRLLAGVELPDQGEVMRPADAGLLDQEMPFAASSTVDAVIDAALAEVRSAVARLDELAQALIASPQDPGLLATYGDTLDWVQVHEAWETDRRAQLVLGGLGLAGMVDDRRLRTLSGGQRSRLALAALLIRQPGALLLDEPTNHLDDEAIDFLEQHLRQLPGLVVLASHDRVFLDEVCTDIVDLDPALAGVTRYGGNYSDYLDAKRSERQRWEQRYAREQDTLGQLRYAVKVTARESNHHRPPRDNNKLGYHRLGGRVQRQVSRRVRDAQQRLDQLTRDQVRKPPRPLTFSGRFESTTNTSHEGLMISVRDIRVSGRLALPRLDVHAGDRLLVTGANGSGKSTLLAVLAGRLVPEQGSVARRRGVRVGLLEQEAFFADPQATPTAIYGARQPALSELGLLPGRALTLAVERLSVGQRRRLALAMLIGQHCDVLLLDEPTNHLSLTLAEELEEALQTAPIAVVVATHDRWLRRRWDGAQLRLPA